MNLFQRKPIQITKHENVFIIPSLMDYTKNYIYYVISQKEKDLAFIIDPGEASSVIDFLENLNPNLPKPKFILNTHHHWDHVNGNLELKKKYGLKILAAKSDFSRIPGIDDALEYNSTIQIGEYNFEIIHTPGHTMNHIAFYCKETQSLFCGDTMFSGGCGGIFEGTPDHMFISFEKFSLLPDSTKVFTAHEYTIGNLKFASYLEPENQEIKDYMNFIIEKIKNGLPSVPSKIEIEKKINPFLKYSNSNLRQKLKSNNSESNLSVFKKIMKQKENYYN
jgi:hydroxyacylglutathione hydrolase